MADDMYLENIDEYINDENRIVTYKWLSRTLSVHVNLAKQMLYAFVQEQQTKSPSSGITVTYLVAGVTTQRHDDNDEKLHLVQIVPEEQLAATKAALNVVTSCHIYSVQKSKVRDPGTVLYQADYELNKQHLLQASQFSAITNPSAQPRSAEELDALRKMVQPTKAAPNFSRPAPATAGKQTVAPPKAKADIGAMFAKQEKKKAAGQEGSKTDKSAAGDSAAAKPTSTADKAKAKPKPGGGIGAMFAKQAAKPKVEKPKLDEEDPIPKKKDSPVKKESPKKSEPAKNEKKSEPAKKASKSNAKAPKASSKKTNSSRRGRGSDDDDGASQKKRRRIQNRVWSDDSSEEEEVDMEEEPIPERVPSPPPKVLAENSASESEQEDPVKPVPKPAETKPNAGSNGVKRRKHIKKQVTKTYLNDEGYMVTEKVMESASETDQSEAEDSRPALASKTVPQKTSKKTTPEKKKKSPVKAANKQANIMSFFKKK